MAGTVSVETCVKTPLGHGINIGGLAYSGGFVLTMLLACPTAVDRI